MSKNKKVEAAVIPLVAIPEVVSKVPTPEPSKPLVTNGTPIGDVPVYTHVELPIHNAPPRIKFKALGGRNFYFSKMKDNQTIMAWEELKAYGGEHEERLGLLRTNQVDISTLKEIGAWDELSPEDQKKLENGVQAETHSVKEQMDKARAARRSKYDNVPRELECIQCHSKKPIPPGTLVARVEKIRADKSLSTYSIEDYVKVYKCRKCNPVLRGRKENPELAGLPKTMTCACGKTVATNPYQLKAKAEKLGTTILELIKNFKCQKCAPRSLKRKANPEMVNVPKEMKCSKCGVVKPCAPSYLVQRAKAKNITVKEFVDGYLCSNCGGPKRGRPSKK